MFDQEPSETPRQVALRVMREKRVGKQKISSKITEFLRLLLGLALLGLIFSWAFGAVG